LDQPRLRAFLLLAGAGAVVVLIGVLGLAGSLAGLAAMAVGALLTRALRPGPGSPADWWAMLALGAALVAVGVPLGLAWETPGGLLEVVGAGLGIVAVALGWP
jgi:hypothetical protein